MSFIPKKFQAKWDNNKISILLNIFEDNGFLTRKEFGLFEDNGFKVEEGDLILSGLNLRNTYDKPKIIENVNFYFSYFQCCNFKDVCFKNVNFSQCTFDEVYLRRTKFENCIFIGTKFIDSDLMKTDFERSILRHVNFRGCVISGLKIDRIRTSSDDGNSPKSHESKRDIYAQLKSNCYSIGDYDTANYYKERELDELLLFYMSNRKFLKWLLGKLFILTTGYGYRPLYVFKSSIFIILFFSICYMFSGFNSPFGMISYKVTLNPVDWVSLKELVVAIMSSFYYSFVTFSNFNSNSFEPLDNIFNFILNPIENMLGVILFSLFVIVSVNKFYRG